VADEKISPGDPWKRYVPWARVLFAAAALGGALRVAPRAASWILAATGVFLAYGLVLAWRKRTEGRIFGPLVLFVDVIFFLVIARAGAGSLFWLPSLYFLYLMAEAVAFHSSAEVLLAAVVSAAFCGLAPSPNVVALRDTTVVAGLLAYLFSRYKKRMEARILQLAGEARQTREQASSAREAERVRIASDFHDGPLQSFISLQMRLEILRKLLERDVHAGMDDLQDLQTLAQQQVKELRAFVRGMRPLDLQGSNLFASARRVCQDFEKESGIPVTFVGGDGPLKMADETAAEVVQMLREALHNVLKHAGATRVAVSVEPAGNTLEIAIDDNGRGFQFSGEYTLDELELLRLGPASLKRRARAVNSDMTLESRPGQGAGIKLRIPLA
jgi:signal transduction histidine kinase